MAASGTTGCQTMQNGCRFISPRMCGAWATPGGDPYSGHWRSWRLALRRPTDTALAPVSEENSMLLTTTYYILEGQTPVPVADAFVWAQWLIGTEPQVARTAVTEEVCVSTIF